MNNAQMMAAIMALPACELLTASKIDDPIGADRFYSARTVVELLAAERERCAKLVPDEQQPDKWHESEAHQQDDMRFCAGWNAARKAFLSALAAGA